VNGTDHIVLAARQRLDKGASCWSFSRINISFSVRSQASRSRGERAHCFGHFANTQQHADIFIDDTRQGTVWQTAHVSGFDILHSFCTSTYVHKILWITLFVFTKHIVWGNGVIVWGTTMETTLPFTTNAMYTAR